ncbi:MAG: shikimate dehydrogenase [Candidatus Aureabacteria bacterium]|nr:shikimate dehydrogenase [Candidatus Auribacterota bacterium]
MKKVLLLGHPLGHSASPVFQNAGFKALGVDVTYELCDILPEELESKIKEIKESDEYLGCNVTIPYKTQVIPFIDELDAIPEKGIGAVNTINKSCGLLYGHNTDLDGFLKGVREKLGFSMQGKTVFIAGAGGAGRVAAFVALGKAKKIVISDVDDRKSSELTEHLTKQKYLSDNKDIEFLTVNPLNDVNVADKEVSSSDLIVNATPLGMGKDTRKSINTEVLHPGQFVFDLVYNPLETPLLKDAKQKGLKCCNGLVMLLWQGMEAFDFWLHKELNDGTAPPHVYKAMEDALKNHFGVAEL